MERTGNMKILISVDMEGIAGVTCWDDVDD
ncbi:MAG: M55 family metallopeptidase, partial [Anaerolineales bacterium]|nr:M55 family metallopeptidase [Anaerolineales bacterium]